MQKYRLILVVIIFSLISFIGIGKEIGIGVFVGSDVGIHVNIPSSKNKYVALNTTYNFEKETKIVIFGDYILKNNKIAEKIFVDYGGSIKVCVGKDASLTALAKLGSHYEISKIDGLEVFGDIAPGIQILPSTDVVVGIEIGLRYFFKTK